MLSFKKSDFNFSKKHFKWKCHDNHVGETTIYVNIISPFAKTYSKSKKHKCELRCVFPHWGTMQFCDRSIFQRCFLVHLGIWSLKMLLIGLVTISIVSNLSRDLSWTHIQRVLWICGLKPLTVSHHVALTGGQWSDASGGMKYLIKQRDWETK